MAVHYPPLPLRMLRLRSSAMLIEFRRIPVAVLKKMLKTTNDLVK